MQPAACQTDPNLIAETYRNHVITLPIRFEKQFDFIDVNQDGVFLLGTSNLTGRIWSGSLWLFNNISDPPDVEKCLVGMEFDSGIPVGKWCDNGLKIAVGTDSGTIHVLSLMTMTDINKKYLSSIAIVSEHDDGISTLDVTKDSRKILSGSADMNIKVWDMENILCEKTYDCSHAHAVTSACFEPGKDDVFVSTSLDGTSLIWDTHLEKPASLLMKTDSGYTASHWIDSNCVALGANCGSVSLIDLRMKAELDRNFCSKRPIHDIVYNNESEFLAVCADDPVVRIFDCSQKILTNVYECERHSDFVRGLTWESPNILYSCAWDSKLYSHTLSDNQKSSTDASKVNGSAEPANEIEQEKENDKC